MNPYVLRFIWKYAIQRRLRLWLMLSWGRLITVAETVTVHTAAYRSILNKLSKKMSLHKYVTWTVPSLMHSMQCIFCIWKMTFLEFFGMANSDVVLQLYSKFELFRPLNALKCYQKWTSTCEYGTPIYKCREKWRAKVFSSSFYFHTLCCVTSRFRLWETKLRQLFVGCACVHTLSVRQRKIGRRC